MFLVTLRTTNHYNFLNQIVFDVVLRATMANIYMFLMAACARMLGRLDSNLASRLQSVLIPTVADTFLIGWA